MAKKKEAEPKEKKATKKVTEPKEKKVAKPKEVVEVPELNETKEPGFFKKMLSGENKALFIGANVLLVVVAAIVLVMVFSGSAGNGIILAYPDSDYNVDLFTAVYGKENKDPVRIMKNLDMYASYSYFFLVEGDESAGTVNGAKFIPELDKIFFFYDDDGKVIIEQMDMGGDETDELFDSSDSITAALFIDEGRLIIQEEKDSGDRCYFTDLKESAERIAKADSCWIMGYNTVTTEDNDKLYTYDINKEEEIELLDDLEDVYGYYISDDFTTVAYTLEDDDEMQLFTFDKDGDEVELSEEIDRVSRVSFQPGSTDDGLFIGVDSDDVGIYRFSNDDPIIEDDYLTYAFTEDGKYAIILAGGDYDDISVYSYNMSKDDLLEIYSGEEISMTLWQEAETLIIVEYDGDDIVLFTSNFNGKGLEKIYDEGDLVIVDSYGIPGVNKLFLEVEEDDETSLFVNEVDKEERFVLIEEWFDFDILNYSPDGKYLVFSGREDDNDDTALFVVEIKEDADIVELHELDENYYWYQNAVFTPNSKSVLFSAPTGDDNDEIAVFEVPIDGGEDATELYDEAFLQDVEWSDLEFNPTWLNEYYASGY